MEKLVSILMPNYNHAHFIEKAIQSIISQTYENWQLHIVDDGSTDNSLAIIKKYVRLYPKKINLYVHPKNKNLAATYKLAFSKATGAYIAFLEADDMWTPTNLEKKVAILEQHENVVLVFNDVKTFGQLSDKSEKDLAYIKSRLHTIHTPFHGLKAIMSNNFIATFSASIIRNKHVRLNFSKEYEAWLDWWLWIQYSLLGYFYYIPEKLTLWQTYSESNNHKFLNTLGNVTAHRLNFLSDCNWIITKNLATYNEDFEIPTYIRKNLSPFWKLKSIIGRKKSISKTLDLILNCYLTTSITIALLADKYFNMTRYCVHRTYYYLHTIFFFFHGYILRLINYLKHNFWIIINPLTYIRRLSGIMKRKFPLYRRFVNYIKKHLEIKKKTLSRI